MRFDLLRLTAFCCTARRSFHCEEYGNGQGRQEIARLPFLSRNAAPKPLPSGLDRYAAQGVRAQGWQGVVRLTRVLCTAPPSSLVASLTASAQTGPWTVAFLASRATRVCRARFCVRICNCAVIWSRLGRWLLGSVARLGRVGCNRKSRLFSVTDKLSGLTPHSTVHVSRLAHDACIAPRRALQMAANDKSCHDPV